MEQECSAAPAANGIGAAPRRVEDRRLLTGRGAYTDDLHVPGQLRAVFVRSPHAHADIVSIDVTAAAAAAGVAAVWTGQDLLDAGVGILDLDLVIRNHDGGPILASPRRPLSAGRVRYVGEPVAVVVAETLAAARDAAERVHVVYRALPAVTDCLLAARADAPTLWEGGSNVCCEVRYGNAAETDRLFATAARVVRLSLVNQRVVANPMEPRSAVALFDPATGMHTLHCSHQAPFVLRSQLCATFGLPEHKLRVVSGDVGGGFGIKAVTYPEEATVLWAASRLARAVKWTCDRTELFLSDAHSRDHVTDLELACDADGVFLALRVADVANLGGYLSSFGLGPPIFAQMGLSAGPYRIQAVAGRVRVVYTNTVPTDAYRGSGRPETTFMLERLVDCAAHDFGLSPVEIRRRNLIPAGAMPWKSPLGRIYDTGDFPRHLELALAAADADGFATRREAARRRGKLRGLGVACYVENSGIGPSDMVMSRGMRFGSYESARVQVNASGGVVVHTGTHSHGQGLETALAQLVCERLGVALDDVEVVHGDTALLGHGRGTIGSRSLLAGGAAIGVALAKIEAKGRRIAAHMLECSDADLGFASGRFTVTGTDRSVTFAEVARQAYFPLRFPIRDLELGLDESGYWDPTAVTCPAGCHACEVELDPDSGTLTVERFVAVDDFGTVVNPMIVEGQVQGGVVQGLGQAACEHAVYDAASGQLLAGSFMDYAMPRADVTPPVESIFNGYPCSTNPLGVKGCGEAGTIGATPALANAVMQALATVGIRHVDMPLTAERLWRAASSAT